MIKQIGDAITVKRAFANTAVTAGGSGDATLITGHIIDRAAIGWPKSMVFAVPYSTTLAAAATLSLAYTVQEGDASNLSDAATLQTATSAVIQAGGAGGTFVGCAEIDVNLEGAGRYIRVNATPDLSAGNTDTAQIAGVLVLGCGDRLPQ